MAYIFHRLTIRLEAVAVMECPVIGILKHLLTEKTGMSCMNQEEDVPCLGVYSIRDDGRKQLVSDY